MVLLQGRAVERMFTSECGRVERGGMVLATDRGVFRGGNGNRVLSRAQSRHDAQLVPALGPPLLCWARVLLCHQCFKFRETQLVLGLGFMMANLERTWQSLA